MIYLKIKNQKSFLISALIVFAGLTLASQVMAAPVNYSSNTNVSVGGYTLTIKSGSVADLVQVSANSLSAQMSSSTGGTFVITSGSADLIGSGGSTSLTCSSNVSTLTLSGSGATATTTITLAAANYINSPCTIAAPPSYGGGGGYTPVSPTPTPISATTTIVTTTTAVAAAAAPVSGGTIVSPTAVSPISVPTIAPTVINFTSNLKFGDRNDDVKTLQTLLAQDSAIYPNGVINGRFGPKTKKAVIRFQKKYGIRITGIVGPLTRAKLAQVYGGATAVAPAQVDRASLLRQLQSLQYQLFILLQLQQQQTQH